MNTHCLEVALQSARPGTVSPSGAHRHADRHYRPRHAGVAMLVARGRLQLTIDADTWIANVEALPLLKFVPVDNRVAARAVQLDSFPSRDPADRMIVATALGLSATLVTADRRIRAYGPVSTVWD